MWVIFTSLLEDRHGVQSNPLWRVKLYLLQKTVIKAELEKHLINFYKDNEALVNDPFVLWNALKAFMRGMFIKIGARAKMQRQKQVNNLTN